MIELKNKVALITGGNRGIGFGIAKILLSKGMKVVITSRTSENALLAAKELNKLYPGKALGFACDVRQFAEQETVIKDTLAAFGSIDALIANAGVGHFASVENLSVEKLERGN